MAKNLRHQDTRIIVNSDLRQAVVAECKRQEESCLYTSTMLYIWLRTVRFKRRLFVSAPIMLSGIAGLALAKEYLPLWAIISLTFLAGLFPALERALKLETDVEQIAGQAGQYKALQDRFRRIANIDSLDDPQVAKSALEEAMASLDQVRAASITPPERYYQMAKKKIEHGDYDFAVDDQANASGKAA
jgi:hypothetical protein